MAYTIDADKCDNCGQCASECAVDAITEVDGKHVIDSAECIDCNACADVCPQGAVSQD